MIQYLRLKKWRNIIKNSGLFDEQYYISSYPNVRLSDMDPIMHYLSRGSDDGLNPSESFNTTYYLNRYNDVKESKVNPLVHYILFGKIEGRLCSNIKKNNTAMQQFTYPLQNSLTIEQSIKEYISKNYGKDDLNNMDNIIKFIKTINTSAFNIKDVFDAELYMELYKDIKRKNINPLVHYLLHGLKEGRIAYLNRSLYVKKGSCSFSKEKKTIVFVTHESSATGAPLLGFSMVDKLKKNYNVIHIIMNKKQEKLHHAMIENSFLTIDNIENNPYLNAKYLMKSQMLLTKIECVICNSVVCRPVLQAAFELKIPTLTLVHEFSDYTRPQGSMRKIVEYSDNIIVPATIIKDSIYEDILETSSAKQLQQMPNNIYVLPQGKLPFIPDSHGHNDSIIELKRKFHMDEGKKYKLIVGSGWVQIRKGVDLFVATAKKIKSQYQGYCKFVWVGEGYDPINDFAFSIWLQRELKYSGLEDDFIFLEHQKNLDNIFMMADLFCLTSRMDPFPNVVVDALSHDLPIVCFEHTTGSAEFLKQHNANCYIAAHLDVDDLAKGSVDILQQKNSKTGLNKSLVKKALDFDTYISEVEKYIQKSIVDNEKKIKLMYRLAESKQFDASYYSYDERADIEKCYTYIGNTLKNLYDFNPKVGFSHSKWLSQYPSKRVVTSQLLEELIGGETTHEAVIIPSNKATKDHIIFTYAVHLHLFYIDLAKEFEDYFKNLPGVFDLYITTINQNQEEVKKLFTNSGARKIFVKNIDNIGRDFAPMLFEVGHEILQGGYTVVGHFHSKKSADISDNSGDRWRHFLLETLMGTKEVALSILDLFQCHQELGLVFPDDRHIIDIGSNKKYVRELCKMLNIPEIEETPLFPIGNMFWARIEAIEPLFMLNKYDILQEEPLPYDGSYMHALERVTPAVVRNNNFKYLTVYREGFQW